MRDFNLKCADIIFILYEMGNDVSIEEAVHLFKTVKQLRKDLVPVILVGTKLDLHNNSDARKKQIRNQAFCRLESIDRLHVLTSAKHNIGLDSALFSALDAFVQHNPQALKHQKAIKKLNRCIIC